MKKVYFLLYLILFIPKLSNAQCFECVISYGNFTNDVISGLEITRNGFVVTSSDPNYNYLRSYDKNCNLIWNKSYGDIFSHGRFPMDLKLDRNDDIYVYEFHSYSGYDKKNITKFDKNGNQLWEIVFSDRHGINPLNSYWYADLVDYKILNNKLYIIGSFNKVLIINGEIIYDFRNPNDYYNYDQYFISSFSLDGEYISTKLLNNYTDQVKYHNVVLDKDENLYLSKTKNIPYENNSQTLIEKIDNQLNPVYQKIISQSNYDEDMSNVQPLKLFYSKSNNIISLFSTYNLKTNLGDEIIISETDINYPNHLLNNINIENGELLNYRKFDFIPQDLDYILNDNYIDILETPNKDYLITKFNKKITFNSQTITPKISEEYEYTNSDQDPIYDTNIILFEIDQRTIELNPILTTNHGPKEIYLRKDSPKLIRFLDDENLLIAGEFQSLNFEINNIHIPNQSGNGNTDYFIYKYNLNNQPNNISLNIENTCLGIPTNFSIDGNFDSILWNFGDGTTSTENNPIHQYNYSGTYNVIAFITCNGETREFSKNIVITPSINLEEISEINVCEENSNTGIGIFNTTHIPYLLLQNRNDIELKYYSSNNTEIRNFISDSYQNTTQFNERITIKAFYRNNPTCISETILNLNVLPKTELPNIQEELVFCYTNLKQFNEININGENLKFYDETGNQIDSNQEISSGVYFVTATTDGKCESNRIELNILIQQTLPPTSDTIQTFCAELNPTIAQLQANGENIKWYETLNSQNPLPYNTLLINGKTYYATQTNQNCESLNRVSTTVNLYNQTIISTSFIEICKDFNTIATFDLTEKRNELARDLGISPNQILFFTNLNDAQNNQNPIEIYFSNNQNLTDIYATIISDDPCRTFYKIPLIEHINPVINLENEYYKCKDASIYLTLDQEYDSIEWSNQSTSNSISISSPGLYSVKVRNGFCETIHHFRITDFQDLNIEHTYDGQTISFNILNDQSTKISMDQINWNNSSFIIPPGNHTFYFKSTNGCIEKHQIYIYKNLPTFISPNGDGINDTWNLDYLTDLKSIRIFNRYGKLIFHKLMDNQPIKWDGKFNGNILPSDSYWYTIDLINNQKIEGYILIKNK